MTPRAVAIAGVIIAILLAGVISPFASAAPDGLEKVAADHAIVATAPVWQHAAIPDYATPGVGHAGLSTASAGVIGTLAVLGLALLGGRLLRRRGPA